jgi:pyrroloquinoline quinone (PQQ) biosynthesis protein C
LALNDLKALGVDVSNIPKEKPLAQTIAFMAFPFYQIQFFNPVGYLGYLFHLEFLPTQYGKGYLETMKKLGISANAMTFLKEHVEIDGDHNKFMEDYVRLLIKSEKDLEEVIYCTRVTCQLYHQMLNAAFENGAKVFS